MVRYAKEPWLPDSITGMLNGKKIMGNKVSLQELLMVTMASKTPRAERPVKESAAKSKIPSLRRAKSLPKKQAPSPKVGSNRAPPKIMHCKNFPKNQELASIE